MHTITKSHGENRTRTCAKASSPKKRMAQLTKDFANGVILACGHERHAKNLELKNHTFVSSVRQDIQAMKICTGYKHIIEAVLKACWWKYPESHWIGFFQPLRIRAAILDSHLGCLCKLSQELSRFGRARSLGDSTKRCGEQCALRCPMHSEVNFFARFFP